MTDLATMRKMMNLTENFLPAREQTALWEEISAMLPTLKSPGYDILVPKPVMMSMMRALVAAESQLAEATAHLRDRDEVAIVAI